MPYRKATIRPYRPEDEGVLFSLARESFGTGAGWSDRAALDALERATVFVADLEGEAAGYVALERDADVIRIEQLLVSPRHEQEGIGNQLVDYAEGFAIAEGFARLQIVVEAENRRAVEFYGRRGFANVDDDVLERALPQA